MTDSGNWRRQNNKGNTRSQKEIVLSFRVSCVQYHHSQSEQNTRIRRKMEFDYYPESYLFHWLPGGRTDQKITISKDGVWTVSKKGRSFEYRIRLMSSRRAIIDRYDSRKGQILATEYYVRK